MSGQVIQLPTQLTVEAAWERYAGMARRLRDEPDLQVDFAFNSDVVRAWADFRDALLAREGRL